jgi:hypothetical protein
MPLFKVDENQNVHWWDNQNEFTTEYKEKAIQLVCMHNIYCCAVAINGCKKRILTDAAMVTVIPRQLNKHMWMM